MPEPQTPNAAADAGAGDAAAPAADAAAGDQAPARRRLPRWPLKVALSAGLVGYLVSTVQWERLARLLATADRPLVAAALVPLALIPVLAAERWRSACIASGVALPRRFLLAAMYAALFGGQFLPSGVGADAIRLGLLWRQRVPLRAGLHSIAVDRICGVAALILLIWAGLPFALDLLPPGTSRPVAAATALAVAASAAMLLLDRLPLPAAWRAGAPGRLLALVAGARAALASPWAGVALLQGLAIHLLSTLSVLLLARAFGYDLRLLDLVSVTSVAIFAAMLPISFNGWGVREAALMAGLSLLSVPGEAALAISALLGAGGALASLPGSVSWLRLRRAR